MKKVMIGFLLMFGVLLAGCAAEGDIVYDGFVKIQDNSTYDLIQDLETGCIYMDGMETAYGLSPYYDVNGEVAGCGETTNQTEVVE